VTKLRERVDQLIRLATNPGASEHEARNAAMQAVRIISENGLLVEPAADRDAVTRLERAYLEAERKVQRLREEVAALKAIISGASSPRPIWTTLYAPDAPGRPTGPQPTWTDRIRPKFRMLIESRFSGNCQRCGARYEVGEEIRWARNRGAVHTCCYEAELAESR